MISAEVNIPLDNTYPYSSVSRFLPPIPRGHAVFVLPESVFRANIWISWSGIFTPSISWLSNTGARLTFKRLGGSGFCSRPAWEHHWRQNFGMWMLKFCRKGVKENRTCTVKKSASFANAPRLVVTMPPSKHRYVTFFKGTLLVFANKTVAGSV